MSRNDIWIGIHTIDNKEVIDLSNELGYDECDKHLSIICALDDYTPVSYSFVSQKFENNKHICYLTKYVDFPERTDDERDVAAEQIAMLTISTHIDENDLSSPIFDEFIVDDRIPNTELIIKHMKAGDLSYRNEGHLHIVSL